MKSPMIEEHFNRALNAIDINVNKAIEYSTNIIHLQSTIDNLNININKATMNTDDIMNDPETEWNCILCNKMVKEKDYIMNIGICEEHNNVDINSIGSDVYEYFDEYYDINDKGGIRYDSDGNLMYPSDCENTYDYDMENTYDYDQDAEKTLELYRLIFGPAPCDQDFGKVINKTKWKCDKCKQFVYIDAFDWDCNECWRCHVQM